MPRWALPVVILLLLCLAFVFRWNEIETKIYDNRKTIFLQDRWTGCYWSKSYVFSPDGQTFRAEEKPAGIPYSRPFRPMEPGSGFAIFSKTAPPSNDEYQVALTQYGKDIEAYDKNVHNYITVRQKIKTGLAALWACLVLVNLEWLRRTIARHRKIL